jgi:DNA-directed RNA polymerase sigma subunit (sigma70/sigma32)
LEGVDGQIVESSAESVVLDRLGIGRTTIRDLLRRLDDLERRVLEQRFGFADGQTHSYVETAQALGLGATRVLRIERRALHRLRAICPAGALADL